MTLSGLLLALGIVALVGAIVTLIGLALADLLPAPKQDSIVLTRSSNMFHYQPYCPTKQHAPVLEQGQGIAWAHVDTHYNMGVYLNMCKRHKKQLAWQKMVCLKLKRQRRAYIRAIHTLMNDPVLIAELASDGITLEAVPTVGNNGHH